MEDPMVQTPPAPIEHSPTQLDGDQSQKGPTGAPQQQLDGWKQAAAGSNPQTESTTAQGNIDPQQAANIPPVVITPIQRPGIMGIVDKMADVLAGKTTPQIATDQQGNRYVQERTLSRGEQWVKIAGKLGVGAAEGLKAGRGGNIGGAAAAGVEAGAKMQLQEQQQQKDMTAEARQQNLDNANNQMLRMQMYEQGLRAKRLEIDGTEHDIKFAQDEVDRYTKAGGQVLAHVQTLGDISKVLAVNPDVVSDMVEKHQIEMVPHFSADGKADGVDVIKMPESYRKTMLPGGASFFTFDAQSGKYTEHHASDPMTQGEIDDLNHKAGIDALDYKSKQTEQALKKAQTDSAAATASQAPSKIALNKAEVAKNYAEAGKATAEAGQAKAATELQHQLGANSVADMPPVIKNSVMGLANYSVNPNTFPTRINAKSGQLDRETAIGLAKQVNPDYDETQYASRSKTRTDFAAGQARKTINALNTAVQHLDRLSQSSRALQNGDAQILNWAGNWWNDTSGKPQVGVFKKDANAVANEMATVFKGTGATDQEIKTWKESLSSSDSPQKLKQGIDELIQLMNGRLKAIDDQWTSSMGGTRDFHILSPDSERILQRLGATEMVQRDRSNVRGQQAPPAGATMKVPGTDGKLHWSDGHSDLGLVQ